jgi:hypothetical protein
VHRYIVRAQIEQSPAVVSALTAASMAVQEPGSDGELSNTTLELRASVGQDTVTQVLDALSPPPDELTTTVAVNAPSRQEAVAKVSEALRRWGDFGVEVVYEEPI